jgi:hypothetical protein
MKKQKIKSSDVTSAILNILTLSILIFTACDIEEHHEGAHVHGEAQLSVVLDDPNTLVIEFRSPAHDILGFEHLPSDDQEKALAEKTLRDLESDSSAFFQTDSDLICNTDSAKAETQNNAGEHMDIKAIYRIKCKHPIEEKDIQVFFLQKFPEIEKLHVTLITSKRQDSLILEKNKSKIHL